MPITQTLGPLPQPPDISDPGTFDAKADAFVAAMVQLQLDINALVDQFNNATLYLGTTGYTLNRLSGAQDLTGITSIDGNAATATKLATARNIGGVSFNGTANISLPGVNTTGNQNTTGSAAKLTTPRTINGVSFDGSANIVIADGTKIPLSDKGVANGVATLDSNGLVPSTQLPSFVDDVLEYATLATFPTTGETGKIYVDLSTNKTYRWGGTSYTYITSGAVDSVNNKTGVITLTKADVGLGSVDNTADSAKNVLSATKLSTPRNINGISFDGSANITIDSGTTQSAGDNSTKLATTAFIASMLGGANVPAMSLALSGYVKLANGLIIQWGVSPTPTSGSAVATFPITFPTACLGVFTTSTAYGEWARVINADMLVNQCTFGVRANTGTYSNGVGAVRYLAIGY